MHRAEQRRSLGLRQIRRLRRRMPVIGRGAAQRLEARPRFRSAFR